MGDNIETLVANLMANHPGLPEAQMRVIAEKVAAFTLERCAKACRAIVNSRPGGGPTDYALGFDAAKGACAEAIEREGDQPRGSTP